VIEKRKNPATSGRESHYLRVIAGGKRQHVIMQLTRRHAKSSPLKTQNLFAQGWDAFASADQPLPYRASSHHHGIPPVIIDLMTGFLAGDGNGGDAHSQSFQIEMPVG
jgi:hypothetical protein